jgi:hypothetical protein
VPLAEHAFPVVTILMQWIKLALKVQGEASIAFSVVEPQRVTVSLMTRKTNKHNEDLGMLMQMLIVAKTEEHVSGRRVWCNRSSYRCRREVLVALLKVKGETSRYRQH